MKKFILSLSLIIGLCVSLFAQPKFVPTVNLSNVGKMLQEETVENKEYKNLDIATFARSKIEEYYGKKSFWDTEWIRVANFLSFLSQHKDELNKIFNKEYKRYYNTLSDKQKENLIGAFLGANYVTVTNIDKYFKLKISVDNLCESNAYVDGKICIEADDMIEALDIATHEATHLFKVIYYNKHILSKQETRAVPEEAAIAAQLRFALPILPTSSNSVIRGTRTWFLVEDEQFFDTYYDVLKDEYDEMVFSIMYYLNYFDPNYVLSLSYAETDSIPQRVYAIFFVTASNSWDKEINGDNAIILDPLEFSYEEFLNNPVYQDTVKDLETIYKNKIYKYKTLEAFQAYINNWYESNQKIVVKIIAKNLRKYASDQILPVPKGYI